MRKQNGLSMVALLLSCVVLVILALLAMKLAPAYIEYGAIKKAVAGIVQTEPRSASVAELRKAFDRRAAVDDITSISAQDLDISKEGNDVVISFSYPKKVPLFRNISLLIEFAGSSGS